jgi:hypothetical protein
MYIEAYEMRSGDKNPFSENHCYKIATSTRSQVSAKNDVTFK